MTPLRPMPLLIYAHLAATCERHLGRTRCASLVGCDLEDMRRMSRGDVVPTSQQRDVLDMLFASLLGRELEGDGVALRCACEGEEKGRGVQREEKQL